MAADRGWVPLERTWATDPAFDPEPFTQREAYIWLKTEAQWSAAGPLKRGQLQHSIRGMAKTWGWTAPKVQRYLARLVRMGLIRVEKADTPTDTPTETPPNIITVCNYTPFPVSERRPETPADTPTDTNIKKVGRKKSATHSPATDRFEELWSAYPPRVKHGKAVKAGKLKAREAYARLLRQGVEHDLLVARAVRYGKVTDPGYVKDLSGWLNQRKFDDEITAPKANPSLRLM